MQKISVIIPIYNVEKYLSACLESVIHQSYPHLEIILVNDGSTDSCPQICDEYATKDSRIKVIHQRNGGLSDARNSGLKIATGEFISFVDSDDLLSLDFCQRLSDALIESDADIVECDFVKFENNLNFMVEGKNHFCILKKYDTATALALLMKEELKQVVWNKIYKKEVLEGLMFPLNKTNEDEFWTYRVFGKAKKIVKIPEELYYYRQQVESIMGRSYSLSRLDGIQAMEERIFYMKSHFPNLENLAIRQFCFGVAFHYIELSKNEELDPNQKIRGVLFSKAKQYNKISVIKNWYWKDIVWYMLFIYFTGIYMKLRDYMEKKAQKIKSK